MPRGVYQRKSKKASARKVDAPTVRYAIWNRDCENFEGGGLFTSTDAAIEYCQNAGIDEDDIVILEVHALFNLRPTQVVAEKIDINSHDF